MLKYTITIFLFGFFTLSAFSQSQQYADDSLSAQRLIAEKLQSLEALNVVNYLYVFSDAGTIVILYEKNGKIKAVRSYYKAKRGSKFKTIKLSRQAKSNFSKLMGIASKDATMNFSNCSDIVHSFNRVVFFAKQNKYNVNGSFTSDCLGLLDENGMSMLGDIYKHLVIPSL